MQNLLDIKDKKNCPEKSLFLGKPSNEAVKAKQIGLFYKVFISFVKYPFEGYK